jgi:type II secretory pathway pseudopilin PulG
MVALLVSMAIATVWMAALLPTWRQQVQRQREDDLIFRGEQIARAIALYYEKNNGALPSSLDDLVQQKHLRKKWKDPITGKDFQLLGGGSMQQQPGAGGPAGGVPGGASPGGAQGGVNPGGTPSPSGAGTSLAAGGIAGVFSESTATSIRIYNNYQQYNQWIFSYQGALLRRARFGGPGRSGDPGGTDGRGGPARGGPGSRAGGPGRGDGAPVQPRRQGGAPGSNRGAGS